MLHEQASCPSQQARCAHGSMQSSRVLYCICVVIFAARTFAVTAKVLRFPTTPDPAAPSNHATVTAATGRLLKSIAPGAFQDPSLAHFKRALAFLDVQASISSWNRTPGNEPPYTANEANGQVPANSSSKTYKARLCAGLVEFGESVSSDTRVSSTKMWQMSCRPGGSGAMNLPKKAVEVSQQNFCPVLRQACSQTLATFGW
mmetsp:Transcript_45372/g.73612  ORF Transcript_45372/g.73612 Transcript_45372/m.73612 type:complete len:202 (-) Transcript_45372:981-1586(-)